MASSSSNAGDSYIGSYISVISKYEIRYEGILYHLNVQDSTIALKNVRSYGTEGRKKDGPQVPSSDKVYEFILFRGSDIKDLQVKTAPPAKKEELMHDDPAIIQSHYAGVPLTSSASPSVSIDGKPFAESAQGLQDSPASLSGPYWTSYPSFQSVNHLTNLSQTTENAAQSFSMPMYQQGRNGTSVNRSSYAPQHCIPFQPPSVASSSLPMQNHMQTPGFGDSPIMGLTSATDFVTSVPSATSNLSHSNFSTPPPVQYSVSQEMPSSSLKISLPSHAASYNSVDRLTTSSIPYSNDGTGFINAQSVNKDVSDPTTIHSTLSISHAISPYASSTSSPLLTTPSLLMPNQLAQSTSHVLSSIMYPDQNPLTPLSSTSEPLIPTPANQAPLLPLPTSVQKHKQSTMQFTEEFDFEAMNEKFKKHEVWGYLGRPKPTDKTMSREDNATDQSLDEKVAPHQVSNFDPKPAYKKDEFFDTISSNSFGRGRNGQNHFSERMKQDTETFGWSNQRPNLGYGSYGAGRGNYYRGRHNWGRGYGYGGRGNGNLPF